MVDNSNKRRKKTISESDTATLLQRYDVKTILRLLQEMSFYSDVKMDWNELVKKTTTGITNAREYQMLWRHLSYRDPLLLPVEDDNAQPLDDDSDIECELEASPAVSVEASVEAIAHVKVMAASYVPRECDILEESISEAPLTINIPYTGTQELSESPWFSTGMNITFPVCLQKVASTEGINGNGSATISMASQRKTRKKWSAEEDEELIAAVNRCGEGNWARIARAEFSGKRTASQLSQRWPHLRRRYDTSTSANQSQQTEAQVAVNHALSLALGNRPPSKKVAVGTQGNGGRSSQGQQQSKPVVVQTLSRAATSGPASKSRVGVRKTTASSSSRSDLMVTANSAAAAACMGVVLTAPSVPKVESVKNASAACMPCPSGSLVVPKVEPGKTVANTRPLANGNLKPVMPSPASIKPPLIGSRLEGSTSLSASTHVATASKTVSNQRVYSPSVPATVLPPKPTAETVICKPDGGHKDQARGDGPSSLIQSNKTTSTNSDTRMGKQVTQAQPPNSLVDKTAVPSISGACSKIKTKCEVNNKDGLVMNVSNACGKPPEAATVRGTGQGV